MHKSKNHSKYSLKVHLIFVVKYNSDSSPRLKTNGFSRLNNYKKYLTCFAACDIMQV